LSITAVANLEEAEGHQHLAGGTGVGANKILPFGCGGRGSRPPDHLYIFNTKSYVLTHSLAPKIGITSVFIKTPYALGEMKTVESGCRMRPEGPRIEAEGRNRVRVLREGAASPTS